MILYCFVQAVRQQPLWTAYSLQLELFWSLKQDMAFECNHLGEFGKPYIVLERCLCSYNTGGQCSSVHPTLLLHPGKLGSNGYCSTCRILSWVTLVCLGCHFNGHIFLMCRVQESLHHLTVKGLNVSLCVSPDSWFCARLKVLCEGLEQPEPLTASCCF